MTRHSQDKGPEVAQALRGTVTQRTRCWTLTNDEQLRQRDASFKYELLRVLDNTELRHLCGRYGIDPSGYGRQQMIATLIQEAS